VLPTARQWANPTLDRLRHLPLIDSRLARFLGTIAFRSPSHPIGLSIENPAASLLLDRRSITVRVVQSNTVPPPAAFIVGVPRSGTTLLRMMLDSHPEMAIPPETHFYFEVIKRTRVNR